MVIVLLLTLAPAGPALSGALPSLYVAFVGDFLPTYRSLPLIKKHGYSYLFDGVREVTAGADVVFLNLETPLSDRGEAVVDKSYTFRTDPAAAAAMKKERVHAVTIANNHILDFGYDAFYDTMDNLKSAGVAWAGAGRNWGEAARPAVVRTPVGEVSFVAFSNTYPEDFWAKKDKAGTLFGSEHAVKTAVSRAADKAPLVANFHWGAELMTEPKEYQVTLARLAIDNGADLVVGHHPHVNQPIEIYNGVPILYSLGNFSFGTNSKTVKEGLMVLAEFAEDGRWLSLEVYPLAVNNFEVQYQPQIIRGERGQAIFEELTAGIDSRNYTALWDGDKGIIVPREFIP
jgi:poly-gamma-glutamate synthesis protein (capsule biosynthesis protein)